MCYAEYIVGNWDPIVDNNWARLAIFHLIAVARTVENLKFKNTCLMDVLRRSTNACGRWFQRTCYFAGMKRALCNAAVP